MSEDYIDPDMLAHDPDYHREQGERPTTFQLTRALRSRMKMVAHREGFPTMIAWFTHQVEEAEKRIETK
jgi:hypothetical protein